MPRPARSCTSVDRQPAEDALGQSARARATARRRRRPAGAGPAPGARRAPAPRCCVRGAASAITSASGRRDERREDRDAQREQQRRRRTRGRRGACARPSTWAGVRLERGQAGLIAPDHRAAEQDHAITSASRAGEGVLGCGSGASAGSPASSAARAARPSPAAHLGAPACRSPSSRYGLTAVVASNVASASRTARRASSTVGLPSTAGSTLAACRRGLSSRLATTSAPAMWAALAGIVTKRRWSARRRPRTNGRAERGNRPLRTAASTKCGVVGHREVDLAVAEQLSSSASDFG